jgi:hypothetical protein
MQPNEIKVTYCEHGALRVVCDEPAFERLRAFVCSEAGIPEPDIKKLEFLEVRIRRDVPDRLQKPHFWERLFLVGCATVCLAIGMIFLAGLLKIWDLFTKP